MIHLSPHFELLRHLEPRRLAGTVRSCRGLAFVVDGLRMPIGATVSIEPRGETHAPVMGEVVGFDGGSAIVMALEGGHGIASGDRVIGDAMPAAALVGDSLVGRVIDGLGRPIDGAPAPAKLRPRALHPRTINPLLRRPVRERMETGIRAVDSMLTLGRGQRLGIFSGAGVGKSLLLGSMARHCAADVVVLALVGERGREVREFVDGVLGADGRSRSVVVASTGDESPLMRVRACHAALAVAEHFRDAGRHVLLLLDSLTRLAHAQRQVGLSAGEPPATRGYPPSVFASMAKLVERAGSIEGRGSITALFTVLVDGDDLAEPIADTARSALDGHVVLSRALASKGHHPAIDVLESVSRTADAVVSPAEREQRRVLRRLLAAHRDVEELLSIGAYARGSNPDADVAIALRERIDSFLRQSTEERSAWSTTASMLAELCAEAETLRAKLASSAGAAAVPAMPRAAPQIRRQGAAPHAPAAAAHLAAVPPREGVAA